MDPKKRGNRSTNWEFKTFSENWKLTQKKEENESNVNIAETDPKYSEIPLHFLVFEGFPIILEKKMETDPNSLLGPFLCWGVSIAPQRDTTWGCKLKCEWGLTLGDQLIWRGWGDVEHTEVVKCGNEDRGSQMRKWGWFRKWGTRK